MRRYIGDFLITFGIILAMLGGCGRRPSKHIEINDKYSVPKYVFFIAGAAMMGGGYKLRGGDPWSD